MKLTVAPVPVIVGRFEVTIRDPGIVRAIAFEQKPTLVMTACRPDFEEVPVLFIEARPDGPVRKRRFVAIRLGDVFEVDDANEASWVGTGISGKGQVVSVFELKDEV
jgi:hypothetical protein